MTKLHGVIGDRPELVIINSVCFCHVKGNIKSKFRMSKAIWHEFEPAFINTAKAYRHEEFKI